MHIAIDISQIVYEGTGVARFTYHLAKQILEKDTGHEWTFFFSSLKNKLNADIAEMIVARKYNLVRWYVPPRLLSTMWNETAWRAHMPTPGKFDLFISSDWTQPPPQIAPLRATIVHDVVFRKLPETVDPLIISTQTKRIDQVVRDCQLIWCDSNSTAADLREMYPHIQGKVEVNYPGVVLPNPSQSATFPYVFKPNEYYFAVGKIEPRKNLKRLIDAFLAVISDSRYAHLHLVIVGPRGWDNETQSLKHPQIHLLGAITDDELATLYQNALAFVFPSLYEGFGIPPLEAMGFGCPVILSNSSSLPEIATPKSAVFVDPHSTHAIEQAMRSVFDEPNLRQTLVEEGKRNVSRFTYEKYLQNMLESIEKIAK